MLSVEQCRKLLGETEKKCSDEEIALIKERPSELAEICLNHHFELKNAEAEESLTRQPDQRIDSLRESVDTINWQ